MPETTYLGRYTTESTFETLDLGIQTQLPKYYRAVLNFRSSTAHKHLFINASGYGEIEWDYSGRWRGIVYAAGTKLPVPKGYRLFQFHIEPIFDAPWWTKLSHIFCGFKFVEVKELKTTRGGLGSTGS